MSELSISLSHLQLPQQTMKTSRYQSLSSPVSPPFAAPKSPNPNYSYSNLHLKTFGFRGASARLVVRCSSSGSGGPSGESDSKSVLDAFFLGKALAEAINERIESTVGEFLSTVGRLQAEQQKQVREFQEEVQDRAKREKARAARESLEAQGLISKYATGSQEATNASPVVPPSSMSDPSTTATSGDPGDNDPFMEILNGD